MGVGYPGWPGGENLHFVERGVGFVEESGQIGFVGFGKDERGTVDHAVVGSGGH